MKSAGTAYQVYGGFWGDSYGVFLRREDAEAWIVAHPPDIYTPPHPFYGGPRKSYRIEEVALNPPPRP